ncbi:MAG: DUF885 domain-containing protein [Gammaproteobacteria bacterium]|nr:DUF885 domain-containing protein [Gammaproteobacteria bacterium]
MFKSRLAAFAFAVAIFSTPAFSANEGQQTLSHAISDYLEAGFRASPSSATSAGLHTYDTEISDYSKAAIAKRIAELKAFEKVFDEFDIDALDVSSAIDVVMVRNDIRASLLELEKVRMWQRNPDRYPGTAIFAVYSIMSRDFAPAAERLESVTARLEKIPAMLAQGRANLENPPKVYTEVALDQIGGITGFFERDVPLAFASVKDEALQKRFQAANAAAIAALKDYGTWLKDDLLPRSKGDWRIGGELFLEKLRYEEMSTLSFDELLKIGWEDLKRNQAKFADIAKHHYPGKSVDEVRELVEKDHPPADQLLDAVRQVMGGLRKFLVDQQIVTIPSEVMPTVQETPPFMRALTFASMDTPGPYEDKATEAYFNVTLPEKDWKPEQTEDHMRSFNRGTIISTSVHEAWPGHYVQFLWVKYAPSQVRKLLGAASNSEGWAHYTEQMVLDQGYGKGDYPVRLGQLLDALLRNARFIVGVEMHRGNMSFEEGVEFFVNEGYQPRASAVRETRRGTSDPTYLYYTLGKLQIQQLRADMQKKLGKDFSLQAFHDQFLKQGFPPVVLVRWALLGEKPAGL